MCHISDLSFLLLFLLFLSCHEMLIGLVYDYGVLLQLLLLEPKRQISFNFSVFICNVVYLFSATLGTDDVFDLASRFIVV